MIIDNGTKKRGRKKKVNDPLIEEISIQEEALVKDTVADENTSIDENTSVKENISVDEAALKKEVKKRGRKKTVEDKTVKSKEASPKKNIEIEQVEIQHNAIQTETFGSDQSQIIVNTLRNIDETFTNLISIDIFKTIAKNVDLINKFAPIFYNYIVNEVTKFKDKNNAKEVFIHILYDQESEQLTYIMDLNNNSYNEIICLKFAFFNEEKE